MHHPRRQGPSPCFRDVGLIPSKHSTMAPSLTAPPLSKRDVGGLLVLDGGIGEEQEGETQGGTHE